MWFVIPYSVHSVICYSIIHSFCDLLLCNPISDLDYDYQKKFTHQITECALDYNSSIYPYHRIPIILVQAQAIQESNWGRSRFAKEGNNFFGIKEFDLTEPHMKAKERLDAHWGLRKYNSMCDSVEDYMNLLSTSYNYSGHPIECLMGCNGLRMRWIYML